ncbi:D-alanyl-D-alanine carboxypeptidase family protein [Planococcus sp. NCCP-2050]|uniref:M15 family metallopeptidase n=1 Tax=Planococcus sp. NCCP-2050 TaxID=2944679 RepID=UPI00203B3217|nr:M15 family metallopeptidase [Planococcus sp. NCCP-2050]GKW44512.1 D-Ala-D-Ala carboxypeptidase VanY [Planococcus sp. NCCP-2050]
MKKWGFLLFIIIIFFIGGQVYSPSLDIELKSQLSSYEQVKNSKELEEVQVGEHQLYEGDLLLVNRENTAEKHGIKKDLVDLPSHPELIEGFSLYENQLFLSKDITEKFSNMMADAQADGVSNFIITSGYRSFEQQESLYQEMGSSFALPAGHSEHHLGLSLDIGSTEMKMEKASEGKWIEENSWKYGFILRYPKDKTHITGIEYEPWHIRYVGLPHSVIMKEKNFVLEEYLAYLKNEKRISVKANDKNYLISYYPVLGTENIRIQKDSSYEISGDNMEGIIVTEHRE